MEQQWNEQDLLTSVTNQFGIYQINETTDAGEYMFESKAYMERMGIELTREKYDLVYIGDWTPDLDLEKIFMKFNIDRPADFRGHSLSMSDVVLVHENGENTAHYVDTIGFAELPGFLGIVPEQEISASDMIPEAETKRYINEFKAMTGQYFHEVGRCTPDVFEASVQSLLQDIIDSYDLNAKITDVAVVGRRSRGIEEDGDEVDILIGIEGDVSLTELKDLYEDEPIAMNGVEVNPQFVEVRDTMPFQVYLEQETVELARQQAEHAMRNGLSDAEILSAQIGVILAEQLPKSPRVADAGTILQDMRNRNTGYMTDALIQIANMDLDPSQTERAKEYLKKLEEYKPLAKVEELVEQNYNMIDDRFNNMKPPEEPHKEDQHGKDDEPRSLRARLKEKQEKIAIMEAQKPEKAKIKQFPDVREP